MKSISEKIEDAIQKFYTGFINKRVLKSMEEVEANTNEKNIPSAVVVGELINKLNGCSLEQDGEDFYIVGADSVRKKLGSEISADIIPNMVKNTSQGGSPTVTYVVPSTKTYNFIFFGSNYHAENLQATKNGVGLPTVEIYNYCPRYDGCIISVANSVKCVKGDKIVCTVGYNTSSGYNDVWIAQAAILPY